MSPWAVSVPAGTAIVVHVFRLKGRNYPRVTVAVENWTGRGYRHLHLVPAVSFVSRRGVPAWTYRVREVVAQAVDGVRTPRELADIARAARAPKGRQRVRGS